MSVSAMYHFTATVHARPAATTSGGEALLGDAQVQVLRAEPAALAASRMRVSFETACERLEMLERMFCEPDGSFVWTSSGQPDAWQVDGNLYDRDGQLQFAELTGTCPAGEFDRLLAAFGWPETELVFQLTREGLLLAEAEFRVVSAR